MEIIFTAVAIITLVLLYQKRTECLELQKSLKKYNSIISKEKFEEQLDEIVQSKNDEVNTLNNKINSLNADIFDLKVSLNELIEEENLRSFGFYQPVYNFENSERYEEELKVIRNKQKGMLRNGNAAMCNTEWQVEGSRKKGEKMTNDFLRLVLMAFNGECDALIPKVKYNNSSSCEQKIKRTFDRLNKLSESTHAKISDGYLSLKLEELRLFHEYQEKKKSEQNEQRRIREQMREENRVRKELEKELKEAEKEEIRYQKALDKAREEIKQTYGTRKEALEQRLIQLERELSKAKTNREKSSSRIQMAKSGYIYIVSNIGSFGDNIYRIGMTRRLDPYDSINDLGYATPFPFDVHAMIFSEEAIEMEALLHKSFSDRRINKVNERKEYFNISIDQIKRAVEQIAKDTQMIKGEVEITKIAEAQQYRQSKSLRSNIS